MPASLKRTAQASPPCIPALLPMVSMVPGGGGHRHLLCTRLPRPITSQGVISAASSHHVAMAQPESLRHKHITYPIFLLPSPPQESRSLVWQVSKTWQWPVMMGHVLDGVRFPPTGGGGLGMGRGHRRVRVSSGWMASHEGHLSSHLNTDKVPLPGKRGGVRRWQDKTLTEGGTGPKPDPGASPALPQQGEGLLPPSSYKNRPASIQNRFKN